MEVPISAIAGSTRLALQVVIQHRRPVLEIYAAVRNVEREEFYEVQDGAGGLRERRMRGGETFVEFQLINIGGKRAESVCLTLTGDLAIHSGLTKLSSLAIFQGAAILQMAPAQVFPLFHFGIEELHVHDADGKPVGITKEKFSVDIEYRGPRSGLGRLWRRKYVSKFEWGADIFDGFVFPPREPR